MLLTLHTTAAATTAVFAWVTGVLPLLIEAVDKLRFARVHTVAIIKALQYPCRILVGALLVPYRSPIPVISG